MLRNKQDIIDFVGRTVFLVFFVLIISAFTEKSGNEADDIVKQETISGSHTSHINAIIENCTQLPSFHKEWVINIDHSFIKLSDKKMKSGLDNLKTLRSIVYLNSVDKVVKSSLIKRFYIYYHTSTADEIPVLS